MDAFSYAWRTVAYFTGWGYVFGAFGGGIVTWLFIKGSLQSGAGLGATTGLISGFLIGLVMAVIQAFTFHRDIDLVSYRRLTGLGIGLLFAISSFIVLAMTLTMTTGVAFFAALGATAVWMGLSGAFLAQHYVTWRASLVMAKEDPETNITLVDPRDQMLEESLKLWRTRLKFWIYGLFVAGTLTVILQPPQPGTPPLDWKWSSLGAVGPVFALLAWLIMTSVMIGIYFFAQTAPLFLIKRLLFREYQPLRPHTTRLTLTGISLVWSLILCWSMLALNPILIIVPLLTTYYVYHSLALPDDDHEKVKRKAAAGHTA